MIAVIETGGKQYKVTQNTILYVEKIEQAVETTITFDKVLLCDTLIGQPYLTNVTVLGKLIKQGKNKKIVIFKYKPKKRYRVKKGHRQPYTKVLITDIIVA